MTSGHGPMTEDEWREALNDPEAVRRATFAAHNPEAAIAEQMQRGGSAEVSICSSCREACAKIAEAYRTEKEAVQDDCDRGGDDEGAQDAGAGAWAAKVIAGMIRRTERASESMSPRWTVSAFLLRKDRVLLVRHKRLKMWLPVGGGIEAGERPTEAVVREVREETGFLVDGIDHVMFEEHWTGERTHMNHAHVARVLSHGEPVSDGSWDSHVWLPLGDSPPEGTPKNVRTVLDLLVRTRAKGVRLNPADWPVHEIVEWLHGLERARESVAVGGTDPREVAVMMARRGVYEGVADDIKRRWGR